MALTTEGELFLTDLLEECEGDPTKLNSFQKKFMEDQQSRFDEYGARIRFSPKQVGVIEQVAKIYNLEVPANFME